MKKARAATIVLGVLVLSVAAGACDRNPDADSAARAPDFDVEARMPPPRAHATPIPTPEVTTYPQPCPALYGQDVLPTFEVEIDPAVLEQMRAEALQGIETWRPAIFRHDGVTKDVMIRPRGHIASCGNKLQLAIAFNKVDADARYQGLRRLNLDTGHCRVLDERLAFAMARDAGINAPCANHAKLMINGAYEGLFTNVEVVNKDFLKRNFGPDGNDGDLWKEAYYLKTNEDLPENRYRLNKYRHAETLEELDAVTDLEQTVKEWAMEAVLPATDNFWVDGWNFYLYDHPERGFVYIPRDFDKALPWNSAWMQFDPMVASTHHPIDIVMADPHWKARFETAVRETAAVYDPDLFAERVDLWWEQVLPAAADDPSLAVEPDSRPPKRLKDNAHGRDSYLKSRLGPVE